MLEIKPIQTKQEQKAACGLCGAEFDADCFAYGAMENGKILGVSQFRIFGGYGVIYTLANALGENDFEALVATGKAALFFINSCNVKKVFMKNGDQKLAKALRFKNNGDGKYCLDLDEYFNFPCRRP
ncbi:MAG: hypothetical protein FWG34_09910 [Oscillospiraceae bacterium]|nr:hypothetical protein [Oscillospiraceae bacterium]